MRSRSNSPSAPNRWKTSRPPGVVVSMASASERKPTPIVWKADPQTIIAAAKRGHQVLEKIH
jgi:hypothetical protein